MTPDELAEYKRRLALREQRRAEVRAALAWADEDPPERRADMETDGRVFWLGGWSTGR